jgi:hypothetical protein
MRLTSDLEMPSIPIAWTRSSTRRVDTPSTYAWQITATSACSARRRGVSKNSGAVEPPGLNSLSHSRERQ